MSYDFVIIGAGIAGASVAAELSPFGKTLLLEAESAPGYHSTGRSAAFWHETYGGPQVQPLTSAAGRFLNDPPPEFAATGFLRNRGILQIANAEGRSALDEFEAEFMASGVEFTRLEKAAMRDLVPGLQDQWKDAIFEPSCSDIDAAGLHQAYLRMFRRQGGELRCKAKVERLEFANGYWSLLVAGQQVSGKIVVNAGGAWADDIALRAGLGAIGIEPFRRTIVQLRTSPAFSETLPLVVDILGGFYFKAEAGGRIWLSPHDETPSLPCDAAPEEIDVAIAIDRFEKAVDCRIDAVEQKWAGLRSFAPDRLPVLGFDSRAPSFFWCAGQGGFGIMTSPAIAGLAKAQILGQKVDPAFSAIDDTIFSPGRLLGQ
jgi:D-arginine dehydrogenase